MKARVIITDDHSLIRMGVRLSLMSCPDKFEVIGESADGAGLFALLESGMKPDIILLDLILPGMSGVEVASRLKEEYPDVPVVILSSEISAEMVLQLVKIGVEGYISKNYTDDELHRAIESVLDGNNYYGRDISCILNGIRLSMSSIPDSSFSKREMEIIRLCSQGKTAREVANLLCISPRTVSNCKQRIFAKMGINNNYEMVRYAVAHGILS